MGLLDTLEGFTGALREAGVPAGTSEVLDATRVLGAVDLLDRPQLRAGLAAALVKRPVHRPTFDLLFDLWWPPAVGDPLDLTERRDDEPGDEAGSRASPTWTRCGTSCASCCWTATTRRCAGSPGSPSPSSGTPAPSRAGSPGSPTGCCARCRRRR